MYRCTLFSFLNLVSIFCNLFLQFSPCSNLILSLCATSSRTEALLLRKDSCHFVQFFDWVGSHLHASYT